MTEDGKIILQARPSRVPRVPRVPSMQRTSAQAHGKATGTAHCQAPHLCGPRRVGLHSTQAYVPCCSADCCTAGLLACSRAALSRCRRMGTADCTRRCRSVGPVGLSPTVSEWAYSALCCAPLRCAVAQWPIDCRRRLSVVSCSACALALGGSTHWALPADSLAAALCPLLARGPCGWSPCHCR